MGGVEGRDVFEKLPGLHLFWRGVLPDTLKSLQIGFQMFLYAHCQYNMIDLKKRGDRKQHFEVQIQILNLKSHCLVLFPK